MDTFLSIHPADIIGTLSTLASMISKGYRSVSIEEMRAPVLRVALPASAVVGSFPPRARTSAPSPTHPVLLPMPSALHSRHSTDVFNPYNAVPRRAVTPFPLTCGRALDFLYSMLRKAVTGP
jgi:hypothetical protein